MRKNDMYLDYGSRNRRPGPGRAIAIILIVVLAAGMGFGGYFATKYYSEVIKKQNEEAASDAAPTSVAGSMYSDEAGITEAAAETGIYGLWYAPSEDQTETGSVYDNLDEETWMADFVDNRKRVDSRGIYLSAQKFNSKFKDALKLVEETELNTMVVDIKSDYGTISYQMNSPIAKESGALSWTISNVSEFINTLHEKGIYVIARVVTMKDPVVSKSRPDLCIYKTDGQLYKDNTGYTWLNPYNDEAWDYIIEVCKCCAEDGFDEVNLDYIRFPTDKGNLGDASYDYGDIVNEVSKIDAISNGIKKLCEEVKPLGIFVSCDLFGAVITSSIDAKIVGQSYFRMAQYLDYVCPMVYPSHYANGYYNLDYPDCHPYELVYNAMLDSRKVLYMIDDTSGNKAEVRPWLQDFTASWVRHHLNYGKEEVRAQINAVYDAGYKGWLLWNAGINYTKDALLPPDSE